MYQCTYEFPKNTKYLGDNSKGLMLSYFFVYMNHIERLSVSDNLIVDMEWDGFVMRQWKSRIHD